MESTAESSRQTLTTPRQPPITIDDGNSTPVASAIDVVDNVEKGEQTPNRIDLEENTTSTTKPNQCQLTTEKISEEISSIKSDHSSKSLITMNKKDLKKVKDDNDTKVNSNDNFKDDHLETLSANEAAVIVPSDTDIVKIVEDKNDDNKVTVVVEQANVTVAENNKKVITEDIQVNDKNSTINDPLFDNIKLTDQKHQRPLENANSQSNKRNRNLRPDASADLNMQWYFFFVSFLFHYYHFNPSYHKLFSIF